jgi:tetratricopeptide (TPR) repeat protein
MYAHYAYLLLLYGDVDGAIAMVETARDLSPLDPLWAGFAAWIYMLEERWDDVDAAVRECLRFSPDFGFCVYTEAESLSLRGRHDEAVDVLEAVRSDDLFIAWGLGPTYALAGRREDALRVAAQLEAIPVPRSLMHLAFTYSALGEVETALDYLEQSLAARTDWLPWIVFDNAYGGVIEPIRRDPRYAAVVDAMRIPMFRDTIAATTPHDGRRRERHSE